MDGFWQVIILYLYHKIIFDFTKRFMLIGKLWETIQKQLINHFQECLYYQPAIIVIDDFDDLCHLNSEPNDQIDMSKIYLR